MNLLIILLWGLHCIMGSEKNASETSDSLAETLNDEDVQSCSIKTHVCKPVGLSVIKTILTDVSSVEDCQKLCLLEKNCVLVTFINFRHIPTCHLLSGCSEKVRVTIIVKQQINNNKGLLINDVTTPCSRGGGMPKSDYSDVKIDAGGRGSIKKNTLKNHLN